MSSSKSRIGIIKLVILAVMSGAAVSNAQVEGLPAYVPWCDTYYLSKECKEEVLNALCQPGLDPPNISGYCCGRLVATGSDCFEQKVVPQAFKLCQNPGARINLIWNKCYMTG